MAHAGSVSTWIDQLKAGEHAAAQKLWESYFQRLVRLARAKLQGAPRRAADEEDAALTERKAIRLLRREHRQKRGGSTVLNEFAFAGADSTGAEAGLQQVPGREPTPEFAALMAEECGRLLEGLGNAELRSIAIWKMEGDTTEEIAARLGRAPRTVERKLRLIRSLWGQEEDEP
jgi:DNA-directed RNA polymerase specialized sigma24 family protein